MAFVQNWFFEGFSVFPPKPSPSSPLQMGSLLAEPKTSLESSRSLDRTESSSSTKSMDFEFDAVLLSAEEYTAKVPTGHDRRGGPVLGDSEVMEWLEAAVFGEDEDFGALLVEPLTARVALGPIYDEIFGNAEAGSELGGGGEVAGNAGGRNGAVQSEGSPVNSGHIEELEHLKENEIFGESIFRAVESIDSGQVSGWGKEEASLADANALQVVMDIIKNVFDETEDNQANWGVSRGPAFRREAPQQGDSWAAVVGTLGNRARNSTRKTPGMHAKREAAKQGGPVLDLVLMDAQPGKGLNKKRVGKQGLPVEGLGSLQEWGLLKEERNPRLKAGKWKSHGPRRRGTPPPRRMGNFGTGKFCSVCTPALSNRLHKKVDAWKDCMAGDFAPV